jgi:hypothetical protein
MSKPIEQYIAEGVKELQQKTLDDVQTETALKWCGRAVAAAHLNRPTREVTEYAHEAVEHAALAESDNLLPYIKSVLRHYAIKT